MKRVLIAGAASALLIGSVAVAQSDQSGGAYGSADSAPAAGAAGSTSDDPAGSTMGAGSTDTTSVETETTSGAGADYAATGERG